MDDYNNTNISDKRKRDADRSQKYRERKRVRPTSENTQTINDKRQRKAEYDRQYRARKKALLPSTSTGIEHPVAKPTTEVIQTITDKRLRDAEYARQYRARKKQLLATSSANNDNMKFDFAQPSTSTGIEHAVAAASAVSSITDVTSQTNAVTNDNITCEPAQLSTGTGTVNPVNETCEHDGVNASYNGHKRTRTYRYSDDTVIRIAQTALDILNIEKMRAKTLHEILGRVNERDDDELRSRWALATDKFEKLFVSNEFGSACSVFKPVVVRE